MFHELQNRDTPETCSAKYFPGLAIHETVRKREICSWKMGTDQAPGTKMNSGMGG